MSEYQYHEFCCIHQPLSTQTRDKMKSLSSRAIVGTHMAAYTYNYSDFGGDPQQLVLDHFDAYFYIANWGTLQLIFKFDDQMITLNDIKPYLIQDVITAKQHGTYIMLDILIDSENGFGWIDGEGRLPELLPLYAEIKLKDYHCLQLVSAIHQGLENNPSALNHFCATHTLSEAQTAFLHNIDCYST